jgi:thioredoxin-dependent peroxiredoxin
MLNIGDLAPDLAVTTDEGRELRLSELKGGPVVVFFYPMDDTPG